MIDWQAEDEASAEYTQRQRQTVVERAATKQRSNVRYESDMLHYKRVGKIDSEVRVFLHRQSCYHTSMSHCVCFLSNAAGGSWRPCWHWMGYQRS
jgi:hypothetical protein